MGPELICPKDKQALTEGKNELVCPGGHTWKKLLGIPRMISEAGNYTEAFGLQWQTYRKTQLDSYTHTTISQDRVRRCLGDECWAILHSPKRGDILEAGCGAGRFTEVLLSTGVSVTSIDYSGAVEANQENFPQDLRHRILQADILHLPFAPRQYDLVFCLGVIQHTPNPEDTIEKLYAQVKPGGWLVIDHYTYNLSYFTKSAFFFRIFLRRMSAEEGLKWTNRIVEIFWPLHRAARRNRISQVLLSRLSPVVSYYHVLPLNYELQRQWALLDTHDSLTDWYKHFRTKGQIRRILERLGAQEIFCEYGGNGVEARCRLPTKR